MKRLYTFRSVACLLFIYGILLYVNGTYRVLAPKSYGDSFHSFNGKSVCQVQSQVLPFQYAGKQQKDSRSSTNQIVGWIYFPTDITEKRYADLYAGYTSALRNIIVRFRKSDLIFPFHYFW